MEFDDSLVLEFAAECLSAQRGLEGIFEQSAERGMIKGVDLRDKFGSDLLKGYLRLFTVGPVADVFKMLPLPNNKRAPLAMQMDLYTVVQPDSSYKARIKILERLMSNLRFDIKMNDDVKYESIVAGLLNERHPKLEVGDFGTLQQFLAREGSFWLKQRGNGFEIDLTRYKPYAVRSGYESYGCKATLDSQLNVTLIDGKPPTPASLHRMRSTLVLDIILRNHALFCHLVVSQRLYLAATTTYYDEISANPKLDSFFYLITYRTNDINSKVPVLAGKRGSLIQMGFGFTDEAFIKLVKDLYKDPQFHQPSDIRDFLLNKESPQWFAVASRVFAAVDKFVERMLGNSVPELMEQTKNAVFVATFYHELMGDIQLKTIYDCDLNARTYTGDQFQRRTKEFAYIISAATMGVSYRILKLRELIHGQYLSGEQLQAWTAYYNDLRDALKPEAWVDVDNVEFSVGY